MMADRSAEHSESIEEAENMILALKDFIVC